MKTSQEQYKRYTYFVVKSFQRRQVRFLVHSDDLFNISRYKFGRVQKNLKFGKAERAAQVDNNKLITEGPRAVKNPNTTK